MQTINFSNKDIIDSRNNSINLDEQENGYTFKFNGIYLTDDYVVFKCESNYIASNDRNIILNVKLYLNLFSEEIVKGITTTLFDYILSLKTKKRKIRSLIFK